MKEFRSNESSIEIRNHQFDKYNLQKGTKVLIFSFFNQ